MAGPWGVSGVILCDDGKFLIISRLDLVRHGRIVPYCKHATANPARNKRAYAFANRNNAQPSDNQYIVRQRLSDQPSPKSLMIAA